MIFGKEIIEHKSVFWFSLQILSETFLFLQTIQQDVILNVHVKYCYSYQILMNFWDRFSKNTQIYLSWKSVQWELSCSMGMGGWTDMTKLTFAFRNYVNAPKN
jgi:hypothetical protein